MPDAKVSGVLVGGGNYRGPGTVAGMLGHWLEPVLHPIGSGAQMPVIPLCGFVAKEIVLGSPVTMTGLHATGLCSVSGSTNGLGTALQFHAIHAAIHALSFPCVGLPARFRRYSPAGSGVHGLSQPAMVLGLWPLGKNKAPRQRPP